MFSDDLKPLNKFTVTEGCIDIGSGIHIPKGAIGYRMERAMIDNQLFEFISFEMYPIFLDFAKNMQNQVIDILPKIKVAIKSEGKKKIHSLTAEDENDIWKLFALQIMAIIMSFTALEAYINKLLQGMTFTDKDFANLGCLTKNVGDSTIVCKKTHVIKETALDDKLFQIIPYKFNVSSQEQKQLLKLKEKFKALKDLRNMFIHLKVEDIQTGMHNRKAEKSWGKLVPKVKNLKLISLRLKPYDTVKDIFDVLETIQKQRAN